MGFSNDNGALNIVTCITVKKDSLVQIADYWGTFEAGVATGGMRLVGIRIGTIHL
jgi:hypothetical protein